MQLRQSPKSQAWKRSTVRFQPAPPPLKISSSLPQISRIQYFFFPAYRPFAKPRSLALRRFVRAPATEHHLAEAAHRSRGRWRHVLELGLRSLLFAQPGFANLPRSVCPPCIAPSPRQMVREHLAYRSVASQSKPYTQLYVCTPRPAGRASTSTPVGPSFTIPHFFSSVTY